MAHECAVSVVLSTFDRAALLGAAIDSLVQQIDTTPPYEIIVVDNNSGDGTRAVVEQRMGSLAPIRYILEQRQGLSYARNSGIAAAHADLIAFTDDDVRVAPDWVLAIKTAFDAHPEVDCLGGRTLPVWPSTPPRWLTRLHWVGPLALQDYGDQSFVVDAKRALCLAGANFGFRRRVFDRIGRFSPEFPRSEDTELLLRLWRSGARALYVPEMVAHAVVQPERLTKRYHRMWHANIGRCNARMVIDELTAPDGGLRPTIPEFTRVLGVPLFTVRELGAEVLRWFVHAVQRHDAEAVWHEVMARALMGRIRESVALHRRQKRAGRGNRSVIPDAASIPAAAPALPVHEPRDERCHDARSPIDRDRVGCRRPVAARTMDG